MTPRPIKLALAAAAAALTLAACSSGTDTSTSATPTQPTSAAASPSSMMSGQPSGGMMSGGATTAGSAGDISFAQLMIPHHQQAIEMADLAAANAKSAQVKDLAAQIKAAQGPEINTMTGWLKTWNEPTMMPSASSSDDSMGGMDMGGMTASGMMSAADMAKLAKAKGADFDSMWLTMMIAHHQGAITMAQQVAATTTDPAVKTMAENIISGQTAEIETMKKMLAAGQ